MIQSERLDLIPMTPAFLRASIAGDLGEAQKHLRLSVPANWPDIRDVLVLRLQQLESDPELQPWLLRAIALRESRMMIGHIGCHTAPSAGAVEFGFTVFSPHRRRGYAREAASALMRWAHEAHGVRRFVVSVRPDNVASQGLVAQLGFVRIGSQADELDGVEDILEIAYVSSNNPLQRIR